MVCESVAKFITHRHCWGWSNTLFSYRCVFISDFGICRQFYIHIDWDSRVDNVEV